MSRRREPRAAHVALQNYVAELEAHVRDATESLQVGQARVEAARTALARYEKALEKPVVRKKRAVKASSLPLSPSGLQAAFDGLNQQEK